MWYHSFSKKVWWLDYILQFYLTGKGQEKFVLLIWTKLSKTLETSFYENISRYVNKPKLSVGSWSHHRPVTLLECTYKSDDYTYYIKLK